MPIFSAPDPGLKAFPLHGRQEVWNYAQTRLWTATQHNFPTFGYAVIGIAASTGGLQCSGFIPAPNLSYVRSSTGERLADGWPSGDVVNEGQGQVLRVFNWFPVTITLLHNNAGSDPENRLLMGGSGDFALTGGKWATLWYDPANTKWRHVI